MTTSRLTAGSAAAEIYGMFLSVYEAARSFRQGDTREGTVRINQIEETLSDSKKQYRYLGIHTHFHVDPRPWTKSLRTLVAKVKSKDLGPAEVEEQIQPFLTEIDSHLPLVPHF